MKTELGFSFDFFNKGRRFSGRIRHNTAYIKVDNQLVCTVRDAKSFVLLSDGVTSPMLRTYWGWSKELEMEFFTGYTLDEFASIAGMNKVAREGAK